MSGSIEEVPTIPLEKRRRILGYVVPIMTFPLILWKVYQISTRLSSGKLQWNSIDFVNDIIILSFSLVLLLLVPNSSPLYPSNYWFAPEGLKIMRLMKGTKSLPYNTISRVDLYLRDEKRGKPSKEAVEFARDKIDELRKTGFKLSDYTNAEENIALIFSGNRIYMITPSYPKAFVQKLMKRTGRLSVQTVHLTSRGERVKQGLP